VTYQSEKAVDPHQRGYLTIDVRRAGPPLHLHHGIGALAAAVSCA
jgi:hypothetical protein